MGTTVRLEDGAAAVVAVKEAEGAAARHLAREAAVLEQARHPGLVEVVEFVGDDERARLVTRHVGTRSLATAPPRDVAQIASIVAAVATTLADLHALGLVHGRLDRSHVLLDSDRRPVLCSPSGNGAPTDDVAALGELLASLLDGGLDIEPIPDRRVPWVRRRWRGYESRALLNLADQARCEQPERRPTARTFATAVHDLVPGARFDHPSARSAPERRPPAVDDLHGIEHLRPTLAERPRAVGRSLLLGGGTIVGLALVGLAVTTLTGPTASLPAARSAVETAATRVPTTASTTPAEAPPADAACAPDGRTPIDVDGDGCGDAIAVEGGIVTDGRHRWAVGGDGDRVAVGDWDCDGVATAALLRPATGEVFVFDGWAGADAPLEATPVTTVDGGTTIAAITGSSGRCHRIEVRDAAGRVHHPPLEEAD